MRLSDPDLSSLFKQLKVIIQTLPPTNLLQLTFLIDLQHTMRDTRMRPMMRSQKHTCLPSVVPSASIRHPHSSVIAHNAGMGGSNESSEWSATMAAPPHPISLCSPIQPVPPVLNEQSAPGLLAQEQTMTACLRKLEGGPTACSRSLVMRLQEAHPVFRGPHLEIIRGCHSHAVGPCIMHY